MKIAAAYVRVSTEEQTELSPDSQVRAIRAYAAAHGYVVPDCYIFTDEGISGKRASNRPAFHSMIEAAKTKPKPFEAILLWKFSRFARSRQDSIIYKTMLRRQLSIEVISVTEPLNQEPIAMLMEAMIEAMDEYYSMNLAEEVRRGMLEKLQRGQPVSPPPLGYNAKNGNWIINEQQADAVRKIFQTYAECGDIRMVTDTVNQLGFRTAKGNLFDCRGIRYILENPVYTGQLRWSRSGAAGRNFTQKNLLTVSGCHNAIIDAATWHTVQKTLLQKRQPKCLLDGLICCSDCGSILQYGSRRSLQCPQYRQGQCAVSHSISVQKLETIVLNLLSLFFGPENAVLTILRDSSIPLAPKNEALKKIISSILFDRRSNSIRLIFSP